LIHQRRSENT